jgi:hypothetical protein
LPVIDQLAEEYGDQVAFLAVAWKGTQAATAERAGELLPSGVVRWGLDETEDVFSLYSIPYQPASVLITRGKTIFERWPGARSESEMRNAIEGLIATG